MLEQTAILGSWLREAANVQVSPAVLTARPVLDPVPADTLANTAIQAKLAHVSALRASLVSDIARHDAAAYARSMQALTTMSVDPDVKSSAKAAIDAQHAAGYLPEKTLGAVIGALSKTALGPLDLDALIAVNQLALMSSNGATRRILVLAVAVIFADASSGNQGFDTEPGAVLARAIANDEAWLTSHLQNLEPGVDVGQQVDALLTLLGTQ